MQDTAHWKNYKFGSPTGSGDTRLASTSVTGSAGNLVFTIPRGTQINTAIVVALLHTEEMQKLPTAQDGSYHKRDGDDPIADPLTFSDLSSWFIFETGTKYDIYDVQSKRYAKIISYDLKKYIIPELNHDSISYQELIKNKTEQEKRMKNIIRTGLLKKRFDYTYTGLNTEVQDLQIVLNNAYHQL